VTPLATALVRSGLLALLVLLAWALLRRRSAAFRHLILAAGIAASALVVPVSLLLPQFSLHLPQWDVPSPTLLTAGQLARIGGDRPFGPSAIVEGPGRREASSSAIDPLAAIWAAGTLGGLLLIAVRMRRLTRLTRRAEPFIDSRWQTLVFELAARYRIRQPIEVRRTSTPDIVATWGLRRPRVLVPSGASEWSEDWVRVVLSHELAHVARRDWAMQVLAEILRAAVWLNPLLWILCSRMRRESESACDDIVVSLGVPARTYAAYLVAIARACRGDRGPLPAVSMAGPSTLERRIAMLINPLRDRRQPSFQAQALLLALMLACTGAVASVTLRAQATAGTLSGHVYDTTGAVLPGVDVVLEDAQQTRWPTVTDASGRFEFTPVGIGRYTLRATLPGFRSLSDQFELNKASDWTRSVTLQVGELEETITVTAQRPTPRPAQAQTSQEAIRVGGNIRPPVKIVNVAPVYPAAMRDAGLEGLVPMDALIAADGTVASVRVLSAQVHPEFARAAEDAVRQWRFSQTLLNGAAVEVRMTVSVQFGLTE
jgi:TonB family protein